MKCGCHTIIFNDTRIECNHWHERLHGFFPNWIVSLVISESKYWSKKMEQKYGKNCCKNCYLNRFKYYNKIYSNLRPKPVLTTYILVVSRLKIWNLVKMFYSNSIVSIKNCPEADAHIVRALNQNMNVTWLNLNTLSVYGTVSETISADSSRSKQKWWYTYLYKLTDIAKFE